jgi:hypothetical protein
MYWNYTHTMSYMLAMPQTGAQVEEKSLWHHELMSI